MEMDATGFETFRWSEELWEPSTLALTGVPRRTRRAGRIRAYVPVKLADRSFSLDAEAVQMVIDAQDAVRDAQRHADTVGVNTIAQQLLRSEAIASSQIEGIDVPGHRPLAKAAAGNQHKPGAQLALANIEAVRWVYDWAASSRDPFSPEVICEVHRRLATADRHLSAQAGRIRTQQNWIGRDPYTPVGADFIPPPAREVPELLQDLCAYASRDDIAPVIQAAAVHAQFETIHPFNDGNGRAGRALVHVMLRDGGANTRTTVPVSAGLLSDTDAYYAALTAYRNGEANPITEEVSRAVLAAVGNGQQLAADLSALHGGWTDSLRARTEAVAWRVLPCLLRQPSVTSKLIQKTMKVTQPAADNALRQLPEAGALSTPKTVHGEGPSAAWAGQ